MESITKFNKNDVSPWLAEVYREIDRENSIPRNISLDAL